ncbi:MAG TPA: SPOR domain-containing protein [Acidobacteriaceae bacterium]
MNRLLDETDQSGRSYAGRRPPSDDLDADPGDREISLGTPTILGIFFALALLCACFFGFGYGMGRKSAQSAAPAFQPTLTASLGSAKPTAASLAGQPIAPAAPPAPDSSAAAAQIIAVPIPPPSAPAAASVPQSTTSNPQPTTAPQPAIANPQPATPFYVQVAAVSSQDVADILLASLEKKGYTVAVHHEPQDKLLHVQIGPFPDRKDAEATRARVLADGFNAIVK